MGDNNLKFKSKNLKLTRIGYYFRVWFLMNKNSFMVYLNNRAILGVLLFGKVLRFIFFIGFLYFLVSGADSLAGYTPRETLFFFLTFSLVDVVSQFLFREVYRFRGYVVSGDLDLILVKPFNPLFRVLFGGADIIDLITLPPLILALWHVGSGILVGGVQTLFYLALLVNGVLIAAAFHIAVLALGIITLEVDHTIMIFRDLTKLGTVPIDIYKEPVRSFLTFLVPIGLMVSFPVKAYLGLLSPGGVFLTALSGILSLALAMRFWKLALTKYSSASS